MNVPDLQCKKKHSLIPVTALQFFGQFLFTGEGPCLTVYDTHTNKRCVVKEVFNDVNIHGVRTYGKKSQAKSDRCSVCAFGSKSLRLLVFDVKTSRLGITSPVVTLEDWIWDIAWLEISDLFIEGMQKSPGGIVNINNDFKHCTSERFIPECSERVNVSNTVNDTSTDDRTKHSHDILVEARTNSDSRTALLGLACVLGHNSVCYLSVKNLECLDHIHCEEKCILYSASCIGRTWDGLVIVSGTVFNQVVIWKPAGPTNTQGRAQVYHRLDTHEGVIFSTYYSPLQSMLASVSDDRSIRLWKIQHKSQNAEALNGDILQDFQLDCVQFSEDRVLYGHSARVWDVKLLQHYIVSIGEDSTCCVWTYDGEVVQKYKGHKGKSIWSLAVAEDETIIATGGGDTSIRLWPVCKDTILQSSPSLNYTIQIPPTQENDPDFPRIVCLNSDCVLTMTNEGVLWKYDISASSWEEVFREKSFTSYSVVSSTRIPGVFAVGNIHGLLRVFMQERILETSAGTGKIHSVVWLSSDDLQLTSPDQLLTTGPEGAMTMWQLTSESLHPLHQFILPYTKQRWVTAAVFLPHKSVLIGGDRGGTLHVFSTDKEDPTQSLWKIHGKTGVTDICCHGDQVCSTGRDGQYRVFELSEEGDLQLLSVHKVNKGFEWIARLLVTDEGMMALGFHTDQFVAYSISTNQKLLSIPCGGGHRAWDFELDKQSGVYNFVYIKNQDIIHCQGQLNVTQKVLKESLHGREVCVVKHVFSEEESHVIATAGEDTMINLLRLNGSSESEMPQVVGRLQGHLSSVRALAVCSIPNPKHSNSYKSNGERKVNSVHKTVMFSAGGRAEIKAWCVYNSKTTEIDGKAACSGETHLINGAGSCGLKERPIAGTNGDVKNRRPVKDDAFDMLQQCSKEAFSTDSSTSQDANKAEKTNENCDAEKKSLEPECANDSSTQDCTISESLSGVQRAVIINQDKCWYRYMGTHSLSQRTLSCKPWRTSYSNSDPETRYMDLSAFCVNELSSDYPNHLYIILAACSDGFVRLLAFNETTGLFTILAASSFHQHCVLKVKHLILREQGQSNTVRTSKDSNLHVLLISAATDGRIAIWDVYGIVKAYVTYQCMTADGLYPTGGVLQAGSLSDSIDFGSVIELNTPVVSVPIHQSGINALVIKLLSETCFLVASGGDDNMLAVSRFEVTYSDKFCIHSKSKCLLDSVHSAQITGIQWLNCDLLLSVSTDQRLCVWKFREHDTKLEIKMCKFINISDVSSCDVWRSRQPGFNITIGGIGLQYLQIL